MNTTPRRGLGRIVAALLLGLLLSACGQKGPLYLPAEPAPAASNSR
ncbi:MAG: lipoprotein [Pigmentiphaga sp.]|nr:lipoprotein [Pigmentiphaga sp.]